MKNYWLQFRYDRIYKEILEETFKEFADNSDVSFGVINKFVKELIEKKLKL